MVRPLGNTVPEVLGSINTVRIESVDAPRRQGAAANAIQKNVSASRLGAAGVDAAAFECNRIYGTGYQGKFLNTGAAGGKNGENSGGSGGGLESCSSGQNTQTPCLHQAFRKALYDRAKGLFQKDNSLGPYTLPDSPPLKSRQ
jgi:hypothetical protein